MELLTECSSHLGLGHLRRSVTLASALSRHARVSVRVEAEDTSATAELLDSLLPSIPWSLGFSNADSDVHVLDISPCRQASYARRYATRLSRTLAMDWFEPSQVPAAAVNQLDTGSRIRHAYHEVGRSHAFFHGSAYAVLRPDVMALRERTRGVSGTGGIRVVISMGGADPAGRTLEAIGALIGSPEAFGTATVVFGPLYADAEGYFLVERLVLHSEGKWRMFRDPTHFSSLLADADVVLCSGGGTLLEALSLGRPCVVYPQSLLEEEHANELFEADACVEATSLDRVLGNPELRRTLSEKARRRVDGNGVGRIVEQVLALARQLRDESDRSVAVPDRAWLRQPTDGGDL